MQQWYALFLEGLNVLYCACPAGRITSVIQGAMMKRAGYKKGFPDMFIAEPRGQYHGLFVELKVLDKAKPDQLSWGLKLKNKGYCALIVPHDLEYRQAQDWLEEKTKWYLNQNDSLSCMKKEE